MLISWVLTKSHAPPPDGLLVHGSTLSEQSLSRAHCSVFVRK